MEELYFFMGNNTTEVGFVSPGNIFGFWDSELDSYKTAFIGPE